MREAEQPEPKAAPVRQTPPAFDIAALRRQYNMYHDHIEKEVQELEGILRRQKVRNHVRHRKQVDEKETETIALRKASARQHEARKVLKTLCAKVNFLYSCTNQEGEKPALDA